MVKNGKSAQLTMLMPAMVEKTEAISSMALTRIIWSMCFSEQMQNTR